MLKGTLHQRFGGGVAIFFQQLLVKAAAVDADADGNVALLADLHHSLHPIFTADIAGIDANFGRTALSGGNGQLIVKMDVRHQRQRGLFADLSKAAGGLHIGHRQTRHLTAGGLQRPDLGQTSLHIGGLGVQHGLDHHRLTAADLYIAYADLSCHISLPLIGTVQKYPSV